MHLIKKKKNYLIFICFIVITISICINDFYNIRLRNYYENLYEVELFDLTQELIKNNDMLKNEINLIITSNNITSASSVKVFKTSEAMLYNYTRIKSKIVNNNRYFNKYTLSNYDVILEINSFINQLSTSLTNSKALDKSNIESLTIISNICTDINKSFKNYKVDSADQKRAFILNKSWLNMLNDISEISNKYSNSKLFDNN